MANIAVIVGAMALVGGGFTIGSITGKPTRAALDEAQAVIPVYADVERRVVDSRDSFSGSVEAGTIQDVSLPEGAGVVVRQSVSVGQPVGGGSLIGVVSGAPYFALPTPLPLYRDLVLGDIGDDVTYLQNSLNNAGLDAGTSGEYDAKTSAAMFELFRNAGFGFDRYDAVSHRQLVGIEGLPRQVVAAAPIGTNLSAEVPLLQVRTGDPFVSFLVDPVAAADIEVGEEFSVGTLGDEIRMTVGVIGEYVPPGDGSDGGQTIKLIADGAITGSLDLGSLVVVKAAGVDEQALAVPVISIREDAQGQYVVKRASDEAEVDQRVPVEVTRNGEGWAAIVDGTLQVGDQVLVSG